MFPIILALLLILAIAFFQTVQGLYSAMINAILALLSALVAFNYYEPLAKWLFIAGNQSRDPTLLPAAALMAIFVVVLLALRILFDYLISGNVVFGTWIDRVGGGALGVFTGMIMVGMLMLAMQMLPWSETVMGYRPYDSSLKSDQKLVPFLSDRFVLGAVKTLCASSFAGQNDFERVHDNYLLELYAQRNRVGLPSRNDAKTTSMSVEGVYQPDPTLKWVSVVPEYPLSLGGSDVYVIRTTIANDCIEKDAWMFLPGTQFRLVSDQYKSYYPVSYLTYGQPDTPFWLPFPFQGGEASNPGDLLLARKVDAQAHPKGLTVDWVWRLPTGEKPNFLEFRRVAVVKLGPAKKDMPPTDNALSRGRGFEQTLGPVPKQPK